MALMESFSGIRGIYKLELTKDVTARYAQAFSDFLNKRYDNPRIIIGRDSRISGEEILQGLIKYIDGEIIDIGILPTPVIENAVRDFSADGGIIITASHNEPEFNGFKFLETGDETGGLKAIKGNSWIHFRQSKTEDKVLRITADSKLQIISEKLLNEAKRLLE